MAWGWASVQSSPVSGPSRGPDDRQCDFAAVPRTACGRQPSDRCLTTMTDLSRKGAVCGPVYSALNSEFLRRLRLTCQFTSNSRYRITYLLSLNSGRLVDPGHLDGFEYLLVGMVGMVLEPRQGHYPRMKIGEADILGIDIRMGRPLVQWQYPACRSISSQCPSFTMLIVYLGISITRSDDLHLAWHDSREVGSSPHALSSRSSSFSSDASSVSKPSRMITWQVVQAQDFSQACSISMPCPSNVSQMDCPPWHQYSPFRAQFHVGQNDDLRHYADFF